MVSTRLNLADRLRLPRTPSPNAPLVTGAATTGKLPPDARDHGRTGEAYDLLAPVYGRFTEGFATKDLRDAKSLLEELEPGFLPDQSVSKSVSISAGNRLKASIANTVIFGACAPALPCQKHETCAFRPRSAIS
jgi:hypothetical protein